MLFGKDGEEYDQSRGPTPMTETPTSPPKLIATIDVESGRATRSSDNTNAISPAIEYPHPLNPAVDNHMTDGAENREFEKGDSSPD